MSAKKCTFTIQELYGCEIYSITHCTGRGEGGHGNSHSVCNCLLLLRAKNVKKLLLFCVQNSLQNISGEKTHIMPPLFGKLTLT